MCGSENVCTQCVLTCFSSVAALASVSDEFCCLYYIVQQLKCVKCENLREYVFCAFCPDAVWIGCLWISAAEHNRYERLPWPMIWWLHELCGCWFLRFLSVVDCGLSGLSNSRSAVPVPVARVVNINTTHNIIWRDRIEEINHLLSLGRL